jgi:hypothetical protein
MDEAYVYRLNNAFEHGYEQSPSVYIYIYILHVVILLTAIQIIVLRKSLICLYFLSTMVLVLKTLHVHMLEK